MKTYFNHIVLYLLILFVYLWWCMFSNHGVFKIKSKQNDTRSVLYINCIYILREYSNHVIQYLPLCVL